ncbi:MAG TPA: LytTR family DNA-binding domain-containing protein [Saprospiraceae bacterium]|nr:LytTR family DNA-binding domain-containing protein [Saprospiraceae bacterium]
MIKAIIIDDETPAVETLQLMLKRYVPEITELRSVTEPAEGIHLLKSWKPDLLFLDIQIPVMNGFDILKQFPQIDFSIIFTTAYDHYAIQAIRFSALDYLLKPIDANELRAAMDRFLAKEASKQNEESLYNNLLHNISVRQKEDFKLALATTAGTYFYQPEEIIRLEAESNYTRFFFTHQKPLLTSRTLREYEEILTDYGFIRTHKSHLINKKHVVRITREGALAMVDKSIVEISRRRKDEVVALLKN